MGAKNFLRSGLIRSIFARRTQLVYPRHSFCLTPAPSIRAMASLPPSPPRKLAESGFVELSDVEKVEEETLPDYAAENYYPARIGEVFE